MNETSSSRRFSVVGHAGCGLFLDLGNPVASRDALADSAFITARIYNCQGETHATRDTPFPAASTMLAGTAEGLIGNHRLSVPLCIVKLPEEGIYAIEWKAPKQGIWVLALQAQFAGPYYVGGKLEQPGALIEVAGRHLTPRALLLGRTVRGSDVDAALREIADRLVNPS
ncbi:MAG TPA: hypothetical protein VHZ55_07350 [Bryobacteraceae bacterium]|nr:hypothetical protein [Bryobacteraceae bacterium]